MPNLFTNWLNALLGRKVKPSESSADKEFKKAPSFSGDDSVAKDIATAKVFLGRAYKLVYSKIYTSFKIFEQSKYFLIFKKILKIFLILIAATLVISTIFKEIKNLKVAEKKSNKVLIPTPQLEVTYNPIKKSYYADDPEVLDLEERAIILGRELQNPLIKDNRILPPNISLDISF